MINIASLIDKVQGKAKAKIEALMNNERMPHAIIFECDDKSTLDLASEALAQFVLCKNKGSLPCGECSSCIKTEKHIHPDIYYLSGTTKSGKISVGDIRDLIADFSVMPNESELKVYIINDADSMNAQAQNAFLKSLEEPSQNALFIFKCKSASAFLPTVLSRCTVIKLEGDNFEREQRIIDAVAVAEEIISSSVTKNELELLKVLNSLQSDREFCGIVFSECKRLLVEILKGTADFDCKTAVVSRLNQNEIIKLIAVFERLISAVRLNANMNFLPVLSCALIKSAIND